jgi:hypothetical protein
MVEPGELARDVVPYVSAVAGVYGRALWEKVQDESADSAAEATVGVGRRLLGRGSVAAGRVSGSVVSMGDHSAIDARRIRLNSAVGGLARPAGTRVDRPGTSPAPNASPVYATGASERSIAHLIARQLIDGAALAEVTGPG